MYVQPDRGVGFGEIICQLWFQIVILGGFVEGEIHCKFMKSSEVWIWNEIVLLEK